MIARMIALADLTYFRTARPATDIAGRDFPASSLRPNWRSSVSDTQYDNELRGALFKNKDKQPGDKRPEYKGTAQIKGQEYEVAAWVRKSQRGVTFMSLSFELPRAQQSGGAAPAPVDTSSPVQPTSDEEIPF